MLACCKRHFKGDAQPRFLNSIDGPAFVEGLEPRYLVDAGLERIF
jgi:hypothetical protein